MSYSIDFCILYMVIIRSQCVPVEGADHKAEDGAFGRDHQRPHRRVHYPVMCAHWYKLVIDSFFDLNMCPSIMHVENLTTSVKYEEVKSLGD